MIYFLLNLSLELTTMQILAFCLAYFLAIALSMTAHEFAHAFVATKMGDNTPRLQGRLTLNPFGHMSGVGMLCFLLVGFGWAKPVEVNPLKFKKFRSGMAWVSVAGVITNLLLAFVFSGLNFFLSPLLPMENLFFFFLEYFMYFMLTINLSLALFNMLPIYPLDGFNFIKSFMKYDNGFVKFMQQYGSIILLIFIMTPLFDYVFDGIILLIKLFGAFWGLFV